MGLKRALTAIGRFLMGPPASYDAGQEDGMPWPTPAEMKRHEGVYMRRVGEQALEELKARSRDA
jgi:hypothetical protein